MISEILIIKKEIKTDNRVLLEYFRCSFKCLLGY